MSELREKVAVICADDTDDSWMRWLPCADRILAIPEIADALEMREREAQRRFTERVTGYPQ